MNHHDIRLIEIGQKEGYAKAVKDIVALLREEENEYPAAPYSGFVVLIREMIEAKFLEQKKNTFLQDTTPDTLSVTPKE